MTTGILSPASRTFSFALPPALLHNFMVLIIILNKKMSFEIQMFRDFLRAHGLRWTPQRRTVVEGFLVSEGHILAEDLHRRVQTADDSIGIATVYRTLNLLVECGLAGEFTRSTGKKSFEKIYRKGRHDHLICTGCGRIVEFEHPVIEKLQMDICRRHGFARTHHRMQLEGRCRLCREGATVS